MLIKEIKDLKNLKTFSFIDKNYNKLKKKLIKKIKVKFNKSNKNNKKIFLNKNFSFYHQKISFGNISSLNLLEIDELLIFLFYIKNYSNYKRFIDIGANIGLHSIIMSKLGLKVWSYEPDPWHVNLMKKNIKLNRAKNVKIHQCAVSSKNKISSFTRVLGNTTGSHISGAKKKVYNEIDKFKVKVLSAKKIINKKNLIKIDAEGEEAKIINSLSKNDIIINDFILEVGNKENAKIIFHKLKKLNITSYSQKNNFKIVKKISDIPTSYKEGSLFISSKNIWKL
jgi:FkbM family methyltransferase